MQDTEKTFCRILFDVLENKGVRNVICSPGSRNVPLLLAASARLSMKKHFAVDERSAAFMGLGISMVSRKPVALICTSGTALLNYAPAVAEAYYQGIPLIVVSADRPVQWIDQDDSQTLRQDGVLDNFVKKSYTIPSIGEDLQEMQWFVNRVTNDAMTVACSGKPGPVHINVHLSEPLGNRKSKEEGHPRIITSLTGDAIANKEIIKDLARQLSDSKVLLVAGFGFPDDMLQKTVIEFSKLPNVTVMAETISNLHLRKDSFSIDSVLTAFSEEILDENRPDIVISIGGALVSRKLKEYLRRNSHHLKHWTLGYTHTTVDPFMALSMRIETDPARFFKNINLVMRKLKISENAISYQKDWIALREKASEVKDNYIKNTEWSELKALDTILKKVPSGYNLFLSNGTPIRYAQIISYRLPHASYCNRGVSGIDGSVSTAIGGAKSYKGDTLLITGDLSMSYDIGSLGLSDIPERMKIIVMDNQGGGIFRFIPSTSSLEEREKYLCQTPNLPLKNLADGFGWEYKECHDENELNHILNVFFTEKKKTILRIKCDGIQSAEILKAYMNLKQKEI